MTDRPGLNRTQLKVFNFIAVFIKANGFGPSYQEMAEGTGYKSKSVVHTCVKVLLKRGYLVADINQAGRIRAGSLAIARDADATVTVFVKPNGKYSHVECAGSVTVKVRTDFPKSEGANG